VAVTAEGEPGLMLELVLIILVVLVLLKILLR
jgi:hypothetical protein